VTEGNEDEAEIHEQVRLGRENDPEYRWQDAQALFVGRENTYRA
jgi:hypothetical protein